MNERVWIPALLSCPILLSVCEALRWHWEIQVPELNTYILLPADVTKNGEERIVVLNRIAKRVVESEPGQTPDVCLVIQG